MSGVLDRMVKQARSTLPTVQPLTAPRFAPAAGAMLENFAETDIHSAEDFSRKRRQSNDAQEDVATRAPQQSAETSSARKLPQPGTSTESRVEPTRSQEAIRSEPGKVQDRAVGKTVQPEDAGLRETQISVRAHRIEAFEDTDIDPAPARKKSKLPDEQDAEFSDRAILEKSSKNKLTAPERAELAMEIRSTPRRDAGLQAGSQQLPEEQRTEIHISIGSIELRAPRVESRPQAAAPFRPRVSLDDFLRRKPEAGA